MSELPHSAFFGGPMVSTPFACSSAYVASMSSVQKTIDAKPPMRSSCPSGVKSTTRPSDFGMRSSIQRCFSSNGWSVARTKPIFAVQNSSARS